MNNKELRKQFETETGYPSWNCNDTVIMEYIEWLENRNVKPEVNEDRINNVKKEFLPRLQKDYKTLSGIWKKLLRKSMNLEVLIY